MSKGFAVQALCILLLSASSLVAQQTDAVVNGSFANGSSGWTTGGNFYADTRFQKYHDSPGYAYLSNFDGTGGNNLSGYVRQTVSIPSGATNASLKFWYHITTSDSLSVVKDVMNVGLMDTATGQFYFPTSLTNRDANSGYASFTYNLSGYVGKQFVLQFYAQTDGAGPTVFRVDDVSVTYTGVTAPNPPSNLQVVGTTARILMKWQDNSSNETGFEVERKVLGGSSYGKIGTVGASTAAYEDSQANGNTMCYRVRATNGAGPSTYSNESCGTSLAPPNLTSPDNNASLTTATVSLSWQGVTGANAYGVDVGRSCGATEILNNAATSNLSYSLPVSSGTYVWRVRSLNTTYSGASDPSSCRTFTVTTTPAPVANFTWSPQTPKAGDAVTFTDTSTGTPTSWTWTFGDNQTSTAKNPSHTYSTAGTYTVMLTVANTGGSNTTSRQVTVSLPPPTVDFSYSPANPTTSTPVTFTQQTSGGATSFAWDFNDGTTGTGSSVIHTFTAAKTYAVKLTATNGGGSASVTKNVIVGSPGQAPVANFSYTPTSPQVGDAVSFTDTSTGSPTSWSWNFGDNSTSTAKNPSHAYASAGTFTVTLTATNVVGSNATTQQVTVQSKTAVPAAAFSWSPLSPAVGQGVSFTDASTGSPTSWLWNFGDGGTSTARNPSHTFSSAGTFNVTLTATNGAGNNSVTRAITVNATVSVPTASFTYSPANPKANQAVNFTDTSTGSPTSWKWTFGDGGTATTANATHTFATAGTFTVSLSVSNSAGSHSATKQVVISTEALPRATLSGVVFLGGSPLRPDASRVVHVTGPAGFGIDIVVDSAGGYRIDVPPGIYALSAELQYTATIAGVPNRVTTDRVSVSVASADVTKNLFFDPPVVFIHGIRRDQSRWEQWASRLASAKPATVIIGVHYDYKAPYDVAAGVVRGQLDDILGRLTQQLPTLRVIAHSKGGLITRALMGEYPQYGVAIADIVQLGTPNLGVQCYISGGPSLLAASYKLAPDQVRSALSLNEKYNSMPRLANILAIVGTENRAEVPLLDEIYSPCRDNCEANDGFVNWSSATSIEYVIGGSLRNRLVDAVAVPYSHSDLGTSATNWVLDNVVMPYFYGTNRPFPSCSMSSSDCRSQCASGRGLTFRGACTIAPAMSTSFVRIAWAIPPIAGAAPLVVTASPAVGPSDCTVDGNVPLGGPDGYRIYRGSAGTVIGPAGQPSSELVGYVSAGGREFRDFHAPPDAAYIVCAVYGGVNACAQSVLVSPSKKRAAR